MLMPAPAPSALSRGAVRAIFIERSRAVATVIRENLSSLELTGRAEVLQGRVLQYLPHRQADIAFLDPPYELEREYSEALSCITAPLVIAQHSSHFHLSDSYGRLIRTRTLKQGDNSLSFFSVADAWSAPDASSAQT
jgi:16S rRNA (guanine966-N2)-methyltransferase